MTKAQTEIATAIAESIADASPHTEISRPSIPLADFFTTLDLFDSRENAESAR